MTAALLGETVVVVFLEYLCTLTHAAEVVLAIVL